MKEEFENTFVEELMHKAFNFECPEMPDFANIETETEQDAEIIEFAPKSKFYEVLDDDDLEFLNAAKGVDSIEDEEE